METTVAVANENVVEPTDTIAEDWDADDKPMPIYVVEHLDKNYNVVSRSMRFIYCNESDRDYYLPRAKNYTTLICSCNKTLSITYKDEQKGREIGSIIGGIYECEMSGLNYKSKGGASYGYAFTDNYMKTHEEVVMKYPGGKAPKQVIDTLQARYGMKVQSSVNCGVSVDGKISIYSVQMRPKGKRCLGMRVMRVDNDIYTYEEWAENYNNSSAWHVDDEGEYPTFNIMAVTKGAKGYNIFYNESAIESSNEELLMLRNGKFKFYRFAQYYNHIDYYPPTDEEEDGSDTEPIEENVEEVEIGNEE